MLGSKGILPPMIPDCFGRGFTDNPHRCSGFLRSGIVFRPCIRVCRLQSSINIQLSVTVKLSPKLLYRTNVWLSRFSMPNTKTF